MTGLIKKISYSFTRPANTTAYADGDLVANSTTAGSVIPLSFNVGRGGIELAGATLYKSDETDVTAADFSLHLFGSSPTVTNGDNGALAYNYSDKFAVIQFATMVAATDVAWAWPEGGTNNVAGFSGATWQTTGVIYGLLEADGAYTPASAEEFTVILNYKRT